MSDSLIGASIDGYRIVDVLGRGGMGTVYKAVDKALDKVVALKMMTPRLAEDPTFLERFKAEAKALARLDAPGIVRVLALRETERGFFIVMEYVDGLTLSTILQRRAPLDWTTALSLFRQILEAIAHAHDSDVLHRDLKPSNILVTEDGVVKITDFGLAKIQTADTDLTSTYETAGTLYYMAPEQIKGLRNVDERSDLFSLGLIVYEMLTGRLPFDRAASNYAIQHAIVQKPFPHLTTFQSNVPPPLADVIQRMLAKERTNRFSDAHAVREALRPVETQQTSSASSPAWIEIKQPAPRHRGTLIAGFVLVGVLLFGGAFFGIRSLLQPADPPPVTPAPPADRHVRLSVTSTPPGATMYVDGDSMGTTPLDITRPSSDSASVRLTKPDFRPYDTTLTKSGDRALAVSLAPAPNSDDTPARAASSNETVKPPDRTTSRTAMDPPAASNRPASSPPRSNDTASETEVTTGVLVVSSEPRGAQVRMGGQPRGQTPLTMPALAPGRYEVEIHADAHEPYRTAVTLQGGDTLRLAPALSPQPTVLRVRVIPYGNIAIDGTPRLHASDRALVDTLPPGTYRIRATYRSLAWERSVTLPAGEPYEHVIDFTKTFDVGITAETRGGARLPNAEVLVDGELQGYAPLQLALRVGTHTVTVRKEGYEPTERVVTVDERLQDAFVFRLSREP